MILLDTNVISEPLRQSPDLAVQAWFDMQPIETLYLSAITVAELRAGVAIQAAGKRQALLASAIEKQILPLFTGRVLAFDLACTPKYAQILSQTRASGFALSAPDIFIAAIAATYGFSVATRDTRPFVAAGVHVINPWLK